MKHDGIRFGKRGGWRFDDINPSYSCVVIGGVLLAIFLIYFMATVPFSSERAAAMSPEPAGVLPLQDDPVKKTAEPASPEDFKRMIEEEWSKLLKIFESEGIKVDLENKRVEVKGVIIRDKTMGQYPIEYVVVSNGGATHEALILVRATPSNLNAALLALGLEPGKTVQFEEKDPLPSKEDIESGKENPYEIIPPTGRLVHISVRYDGWKDQKVRPLEELMIDLRTGKPVKKVGWIYIGSRFARIVQGRERKWTYIADAERNIVACWLNGFGNAIFDINNVDAISDILFDVNHKIVPPKNELITLIFSLDPLKK